MRLSRRFAPVFAAVALVMAVPYEAMPHARVGHDGVGREGVASEQSPVPGLFGAECRTTTSGSHAVAYCHNPYVDTDRVRLHIECARWWDIDSDGAPVEVGPATTVRLTGRCWKEILSVWVSHQR
ncbi:MULTISPECIES: hypothetical protein [Streptomyces]|uniref:Secreted protein n=1 Tax=Streptomyces dengpaensis TaxID=2049881 RepID=A0ABN5I8H9_9ACTN|nr:MULTISPECIES: hypothetical protein [Streptomyces]AVH59507.1 hypothetical protein C4B68_31345 [Streptomyces dengpaensis]PIB05864.1 hypothetical protein B1C81_27625 [Streptomyces sp. HG99]